MTSQEYKTRYDELVQEYNHLERTHGEKHAEDWFERRVGRLDRLYMQDGVAS